MEKTLIDTAIKVCGKTKIKPSSNIQTGGI